MPQMKPMNWLILFITINLIMIMMNIMNYFNFKYNFKSKYIKNNKTFYNWKW